MLLPARQTCPACQGGRVTRYPLHDTVITLTCWICQGRGQIRDWTLFQTRACIIAAAITSLAAILAASALTAGVLIIPPTVLNFLEN